MFPLESSVILLFFMVVVTFLIYLVHWHQKKKMNYWRVRGVPHLETNWIFGSCKDQILKKKSWLDFTQKCYSAFKGKGYGGYYFFTFPGLVICKPNLIEKILVQDFAHFQDRGKPVKNELLMKTLFHAQGEEWRIMRHRLVPSFTSRKVRGMFEQIVKCCDYAFSKIDDRLSTTEPIEVEPLAFTYSTEVIASCAFGIQLLTDSERRNNFRKAVSTMFTTTYLKFLKVFLVLGFSKFASIFGITIVHHDLTNFFINLTRDAIKYRKENNVYRSDFLQLLMNLKDEEERGAVRNKEELLEEDKILNQLKESVPLVPKKLLNEAKIFSDDCIIALVFNFITAGLQPSASTISFCLYEVAKNLTIQKKLHQEIDQSVKKHKGWNYEAVKDMTYLDQVIQETLRMYSFNSILMREVTIPYKLPGTDLILEKGLIVNIPLTGLHMDPHHYSSPEDFNPDRFEGNNYKPSPFFMPFGNGPRICIAMKFAILVLKTCLARTLNKYTVNISGKMQTPLNFEENEAYPKAKNGIWLSFDKKNL